MKMDAKAHTKTLREVRMLARTNASLAQQYGASFVGADLDFASLHKCNIVIAMGYMAKRASGTLALQLAVDRSAQPEVANPMRTLRTWVRHALNPALPPLEMAAGWHTRCRKIAVATARGKNPWNQTTSAMSHAIFI